MIEMEVTRVRCMLVVAGGPSRRVGQNGLLIGRQSDCDIVASDPSVSRRHALVRLTVDGAELVPLGRAPVTLNGKPCDRATSLADGDELALPGLVLGVEIAAQRPDAGAPATWRLARPRGGSFGLSHSPFLVGGDDVDDLIVKGWPAHALAFRVAGDELYVEVASGTATRNGDALPTDALEPLSEGDELVYRKEAFRVVRAPNREATTAVAGSPLPRRVTIEMLPRGGRVVFEMPDGERAVFLADRRFDLMVALLRPPHGHVAGEFIPDDVVRTVVWPRNPGVSRPEINTLISRCRRDLIEAGLAGPRLLERAPGGGGTRIALAPGAEVVVET